MSTPQVNALGAGIQANIETLAKVDSQVKVKDSCNWRCCFFPRGRKKKRSPQVEEKHNSETEKTHAMAIYYLSQETTKT
jgi:hypothetical protein